MATAASKKADKATYTVVSPLNHDNEPYAVGEEVELTEAQAAPLVPHTVQPKGTKTQA
jgi:hypothetical protein